jgi:CHAT domain-containing protein/tetratricopeptide (TPR) repeat protein
LVVIAAATVTLAVAAFWRSNPWSVIASAISRDAFRPLQADVSGLPYRPWSGIAPSSVSIGVRAAAARILASGTQDQHARAVATLLSSDVRRAGVSLQQLAQKHPGDRHVWSDLAACRIAEGDASGDPSQYVSALAAANRSLAIDSANVAGLFNRALALEKLGLHGSAMRAYRQVIAVDSTDEWSAEARESIRKLDQPNRANQWNDEAANLMQARHQGSGIDIEALVRRFPQQMRTWAEGMFLASWAEAELQGNHTDATRWLDLAGDIGNALERRNGEGLLSSAVSAIRRATPYDRRLLARASILYRDARILYANRHVSEALPQLARAEEAFKRGGSSLSLVAQYYRANAAFDAHKTDLAAELSADVRDQTPSNFRALHAQLDWLEATIRGMSGQPYEALARCRNAVAIFDALQEYENSARMRIQCITLLASLGRPTEAWRLRPAVFREAAIAGDGDLLEVMLTSSALDELESKRLAEAEALFRLAVEKPMTSGRLRVEALIWLAVLESRRTGTAPFFGRAYATASRIADRNLREDAYDQLRFARSVSRGRDPMKAIEALNQTVQYRVRTGKTSLIPPALIARAAALREVGRLTSAKALLEQAIAITEGDGATRPNYMTGKEAYFGAPSDAYEELADLHVQSGEPFRACEMIERGRSRRNAGPPFELSSFRKTIPDGAVILHYTALRNRLLMIISDRTGSVAVVRRVSRSSLESLSNALVQAIQDDDEREAKRLAAMAGKLLFEPLEQLLVDHRTLIAIPDNTVGRFPLCALVLSNGDRLIDRIALEIAPIAPRFPRVAPRRLHRALVVADPAFQGKLLPNLPRLPAAIDEARVIGMLFNETTELVGSEATQAAFIDAIRGKPDAIHIAAHALTDGTDPTRLALVLAPGPDNDGLLYSRDIVDLPLRGTSLISLAGCRTGASDGTGGIRSLAAAFLEAGVGAALATHWDVDDRETTTIVSRVYRRAARGQELAQALRDAQLEASASGEPARVWAAFQMYRGTD